MISNTRLWILPGHKGFFVKPGVFVPSMIGPSAAGRSCLGRTPSQSWVAALSSYAARTIAWTSSPYLLDRAALPAGGMMDPDHALVPTYVGIDVAKEHLDVAVDGTSTA